MDPQTAKYATMSLRGEIDMLIEVKEQHRSKKSVAILVYQEKTDAAA